MSGRRVSILGLTAMLSTPALALGQDQGLAAAAEREKERRKKAAAPATTYSDRDLRSATGGAEPPKAGTQPAASPTPEARDATRNEAHWRGRAKGMRDAVAAAEKRVQKAQEDYDGARKGNIQPLPIDALSQQPPIPQVNPDADRLQKELEDAKAALTQAQRALADFEEEARKAGVPPGWLR